MSKRKEKIQIEDLWKQASKKTKIISIVSFIACAMIAPHLNLTNNNSETRVVISESKAMKKVNNLKPNEKIIQQNAFQVSETGSFCLSRIGNKENTNSISCPVNNTLGTINLKHTYTIDENGKLKEHQQYYEPVITAKYGFMLILWSLFFVIPLYFSEKKKLAKSEEIKPVKDEHTN